MNIEKMQKINDLARQLVDRGVYSDLTEATRQAEVMLNKGDEGISSVFGTEQRIISEQARAPSQPSMHDDDLRIQLRKLSYQANEQAKIIEDLKSQLRSIISDINHIKLNPRSGPILERPSGASQTMLSKEATEKKPHARSGNYESDDVSIEKFFYAGPPKS